MKLQRIIFHLDDGRKKYGTHNGEVLRWEKGDIEAMRINGRNKLRAAFTADFQRYDTDFRELRARFPASKIVKVVGYAIEDYDLPIDNEVIF
ncbi:hypothetical protein BN938_0460 [Mucinivorans hirudinis]|uniref:Uncharacterized protein n=1 Tax=Mucinivorans hirudinis TaxID=1433126 RepID=A0A060R5T4_9BACT|nr:hypothetical protein BN938_0088 [Mucinivorans hirudinis]CDN30565.1 hypothetical protein BN938_0460 [Mucinivorans hirudinis]